MQRNTGYFPTESLEPSGNRLFSRSALNEGDLFRGSLYHVDLIPYNVTDKTARKFIASNNETIKNFSDILHSNRISVAARMQFGSDIGAGCGQLYADERD